MDLIYAKGIKPIDAKTKNMKKIIIIHKYQKTSKKLLRPINLSDFLIIRANGINGITKILNGTIAEINAP